ncbi:MAG: GNAT family N-acetyltransferase, partial [Acidothermaceae bacterium]
MIVRDAVDDDRGAIFTLANALALERPVDRAAFDVQYAAARTDARTELLVAVEDCVVGYLLGVISPMFLYNGGFAFVQELCVGAGVRRRGIGAALMAEFEARAIARGAGAVALATSRAGAFYEALGYVGG